MGKRRRARELAVQFLYQLNFTGNDDREAKEEKFWQEFHPDSEIREFCTRLISLVLEKQAEIDELIKQYTTNWDIARIAIVDKNILRVCIGELLYLEDIPPVVSINEAVDIAKKFGSAESGKFVNGILDKIRLEKVKNKDT